MKFLEFKKATAIALKPWLSKFMPEGSNMSVDHYHERKTEIQLAYQNTVSGECHKY